MFFMSFTAAFAASQLVKLSDRYTVKWLLAFSYVFYAISLFLLMVVRNFVGLMVAVIIFGMGHGINIPSMHTLTTEITSRKNRGAVISLREVFFKLSGTVAPLMMGFLYTLNGIDAVYLFSAIYSLGIFVLLFFSFKKIF
jgi:MFS family permease